MDAILDFLNELKRSDWFDTVPFAQRKYNDITVQESEQSYYKKIDSMYSAAVGAFVSVPSEKYEILHSLLNEVEDCQKYFQMPSDENSDEILSLLMHDYNQSKNQVRGLKDDYDYLIFVRNCMRIQVYYLEKFKKLFPSQKTQEIEIEDNKEEIATNITKQNEPIKGVKGLAAYLKIGVTKAQDIINSNILQENGIAYRVGNAWNFNPQKLDELLSQNPTVLYKRNK